MEDQTTLGRSKLHSKVEAQGFVLLSLKPSSIPLILRKGYKAPARLGSSTPHTRAMVSKGEREYTAFQEQQAALRCRDTSYYPQNKNVASRAPLTS